MNLTDVEIALNDYDDQDEHIELGIYSGVYNGADTVDTATADAAVHYMLGLLGRVLVELQEELEAEAAIHGCGPRVFTAQKQGEQPRFLRRGGEYLQPGEHLAGQTFSTCSSYMDAGSTGEGSAYVTVPRRRAKHWIRRITAVLSDLQPADLRQEP